MLQMSELEVVGVQAEEKPFMVMQCTVRKVMQMIRTSEIGILVLVLG